MSPMAFNSNSSPQQQLHAMQMSGAPGPAPPQQLEGGGAPGAAGRMPAAGHRLSFTGAMDPRLSNASLDSHLSGLLRRRPSTAGTLEGLDLLAAPGRRDSMDSTTAVLDACILDLTRRRLSMGMAGVGMGPAEQALMGAASQNTNAAMLPPNPAAASITMRQHELQKQQMELEQRQQELERQRQQLLAGIQETSIKASGLQAGLGSSLPQLHGGGASAAAGGGDGSRQQWWVCHVCNSKAFASREEAMQHELGCSEAPANLMGAAGQPMPGPPAAAGFLPGVFPPMGGMGMAGVPNMDGGFPMGQQNGPFAVLPQPMPLALPADKDWLTPLHCFVRRHCVQIFCASAKDVATPSKGKRKQIQIGQVGIRCAHCHSEPSGSRERGSVYYPTSIASIYNATMNLLQRHLHSCSAVPEDIMLRYQTLKADDARSGTSKKYWIESALSLGLVDTPTGIRFSALMPPPLPLLSRQQQSTGVFSAKRRNSNDFFSTTSNAVTRQNGAGQTGIEGLNSANPLAGMMAQEVASPVQAMPQDSDHIPESAKALTQSAPLVTPEDKPYATAFSYNLLSQMQACVFTEADRLGKRKGLPPGFAGLACRHCFGGYGSGRFFPSSIKTLSDTSKTLNVLHNHMMRCRKCPQEVRDTLEKLRVRHDDERSKMKFGSQKAFFAKIWRRLHEDGTGTNPLKRPRVAGRFGAAPMPQPPGGRIDVFTNTFNDPNKRMRTANM